MLSQAEAISKAEEQILSTRASRSFWDSIWAINLAYAAGKQWTWRSASASGHREIKRLHEILDPRRNDVRVTMDLCSRNISRTVSALKMQQMPVVVKPRGASERDLVAKHVYTAMLDSRMESFDALSVWNSLHLPR